MMPADNITAMQADKVTRKVILLSICEKLDSLTQQELMETALETMYMDYFQFVELLDELRQEHLLAASQRKGEVRLDAAGRVPERFSLTEKGARVLETLRTKIPAPVTAYLHRSLRERETVIKNESSVHADYRLQPDGSYEVSLELYEKGLRYFACRFAVPGKTLAEAACARWEEKAAAIYPAVLELLVQGKERPASANTEAPEQSAAETSEKA